MFSNGSLKLVRTEVADNTPDDIYPGLTILTEAFPERAWHWARQGDPVEQPVVGSHVASVNSIALWNSRSPLRCGKALQDQWNVTPKPSCPTLAL